MSDKPEEKPLKPAPIRRRSTFEQEDVSFDTLLGLVEAARANIKPYIRRYYLESNRAFSEMTGANVYLKYVLLWA